MDAKYLETIEETYNLVNELLEKVQDNEAIASIFSYSAEDLQVIADQLEEMQREIEQ